jgi:hypothetical protein
MVAGLEAQVLRFGDLKFLFFYFLLTRMAVCLWGA